MWVDNYNWKEICHCTNLLTCPLNFAITACCYDFCAPIVLDPELDPGFGHCQVTLNHVRVHPQHRVYLRVYHQQKFLNWICSHLLRQAFFCAFWGKLYFTKKLKTRFSPLETRFFPHETRFFGHFVQILHFLMVPSSTPKEMPLSYLHISGVEIRDVWILLRKTPNLQSWRDKMFWKILSENFHSWN